MQACLPVCLNSHQANILLNPITSIKEFQQNPTNSFETFSQAPEMSHPTPVQSLEQQSMSSLDPYPQSVSTFNEPTPQISSEPNPSSTTSVVGQAQETSNPVLAENKDGVTNSTYSNHLKTLHPWD